MASTIEVDQVKHSSGVAFTLPTADGSAGQLLKTNGSRVLSFVSDTDTGITSLAADTSPQLGGDLDCNSSQIQWSQGADVVSATALAVLTDGNYFDVTGTVTIVTINTTGGIGTQIKLHFDGALTLTNSADIVLPSGANIVTAAGDEAEFIEYASGDYRCTNYTRATGKPVKTDFVNADINASAAIVQSKLVDIVNADIDASAAIAQSKLVDIVNADISASAAIDQSKLAGLDATPSPDHTINGPQTNTLLAGYTTAIGDLVYLDPNGRWEETDANATGTSINLLGIALEAKTDTQAMNVALSGSFVRDDTWNWTIGVPLYVSGTIGEMTATKPTGTGDVVRTVGYAVTADVIFFAPSSDYVTLA